MNLGNCLLALQRVDEARQIAKTALARNFDDYILRNELYAVAFTGEDSQGMARQSAWFRSQPDSEHFGLALESDTQAYSGHLGKARDLTRQAIASAVRIDSKENAAIWQDNQALREAAFGNPAEARRNAEAALKLEPDSQSVQLEAALAFAMAGENGRAESLARGLDHHFPLDTQVQSLWLPAIRAQLELNRKDPAAAIDRLEASSRIDLGQIPVHQQYFVFVSGVPPGPGVSGGRQGERGCRRIPEDSRPQRDRLELLDGRARPHRARPRLCACRRGRQGPGRVSVLLHSVERRGR